MLLKSISFLLLCLLVLSLDGECYLHSSLRMLIDRTLAPFRDGITPSMLEQAKILTPRSCIIKMRDHKVLKVCERLKHFSCFFDRLAERLPDVEFVLSWDDRPRVCKNRCPMGAYFNDCACDKEVILTAHTDFQMPYVKCFNKRIIPLFSSSIIDKCFSDILFPAAGHVNWAGYLSARPVAWQSKQFKLFWRGSMTGINENSFENSHRVRLVRFCSRVKDCDAKFAISYQCEECEKRNLSVTRQFTPMRRQSVNKIIIDIDGYSYSGRFATLLYLGSAVFKIGTYYDVVTSVAQPWVHYVPVRMDLSDLEIKIKWARQNDNELKKIAERGRQFSRLALTPRSMLCYAQNLLRAYLKLIISEER